MRVLGREKILTFIKKHPDAASSLRAWIQNMECNHFKHIHELKHTFRSADSVRPYTVFNISGNKYRLIVSINYDSKTVFVRFVGTHQEYDKIDAEVI